MTGICIASFESSNILLRDLEGMGGTVLRGSIRSNELKLLLLKQALVEFHSGITLLHTVPAVLYIVVPFTRNRSFA